jgi:mannose-6-phosphate isomerase class I
MRQFNNVIFLGSGNTYDYDKLIRRLKEGLEILAGLQQPSRCGSQEEKQSSDAVEVTMKAELMDIIEDITVALGAEVINEVKPEVEVLPKPDKVHALLEGVAYEVEYPQMNTIRLFRSKEY